MTTHKNPIKKFLDILGIKPDLKTKKKLKRMQDEKAKKTNEGLEMELKAKNSNEKKAVETAKKNKRVFLFKKIF